mgnify:FL=1
MVAGIWEDELCIISTDNRSWGDSNTVVEMWCRSKNGHSVLVLVNGMQPYIEISPKEGGREGSQTDIQDVLNLSTVTEILPPVTKWTSRGEKPHWRVMVRDTTVVTRLRDQLRAEWTVTSADIQFHKRLMYDLDLGPHISVKGRIMFSGDRAPEGAISPHKDDRDAEEAILSIGGRGLYPVDIIIEAKIEDLSSCLLYTSPSPRD